MEHGAPAAFMGLTEKTINTENVQLEQGAARWQRRTVAALLRKVHTVSGQLPPWGLGTPELPRGWPR